MRNYIGKYLQQELLRFKGLDLIDVAILEYLDDFKSSGKMKEYIKDEKSWHWISWSKILSDMPILGVSKGAIKDRCLFKLGVRPTDYYERYEKAKDSYKKKMDNYKYFGFIEFDTFLDNNVEKQVERTIWRFTTIYYNIKIPFNDDNKKDLSCGKDKSNSKNTQFPDFDNNSITHSEDDLQILLANGFTKIDIQQMSEIQILEAIEKIKTILK